MPSVLARTPARAWTFPKLFSTYLGNMLGWKISVYRERDDKRLAVWQTDVDGLEWLNKLVESGGANNLGGNGYPCRYKATAANLIPRILSGPPNAKPIWGWGFHYTYDNWEGKTVIDTDAIAECADDEWLVVEAWDES